MASAAKLSQNRPKSSKASPAKRGQNLSPFDVNIKPAVLGMDSATNAMLFAEKLVEYVLRKLGYEWVSDFGARRLPKSAVKKRFTPEIGEAVFDIISCRIHKIAPIFKDLRVKKQIIKADDFRREISIIAAANFTKNEFDPKRFLVLAAYFIGVSAFYFEKKNAEIADATAQTLSYLLNFFIYHLVFNVKVTWFELCLAAQNVRREIKVNREVEFADLILPCNTQSS